MTKTKSMCHAGLDPASIGLETDTVSRRKQRFLLDRWSLYARRLDPGSRPG
jgi:hypothetical protein